MAEEKSNPKSSDQSPEDDTLNSQDTSQGTDNQSEISELDQAKADANKYLDSWKRSVAEFHNYKKQQDREKARWIALSNQTLILTILPAIDDFQKAINHVTDEVKKTSWFDGIVMVQKKLLDSLKEAGVIKIDAKGKPFDPRFHEAVMQEIEEGVESGKVLQVLQDGYTLGETVIRPAMVKVSQ